MHSVSLVNFDWALSVATSTGRDAREPISETICCLSDVLELGGYVVGRTGKGWGPGNFAASRRVRNPVGTPFKDIKSKNVLAKGIT